MQMRNPNIYDVLNTYVNIVVCVIISSMEAGMNIWRIAIGMNTMKSMR